MQNFRPEYSLKSDTRIKLYPQTQIIKTSQGAIFFSPANHQWVKVNEDGHRVLESFVQEQPLGEWLDKHVDSDRNPQARINLKSFIAGQITNGILQADGRKKNVDWKKAIDPPNLQKVYFEITNQCNLRCTYCFNSWSRHRTLHNHKRLMRFEDWLHLSEELHDLGVLEIVITGGEPLLHAWIPDLAKKIRYSGIKTTLLTNGTCITSSISHQLVESFDRINVSLDSSVEEEHDSGRGHGSFRQTTQGIKTLKKAGHNAIIIKPTLSTHNIENFHDLPRFVKQELGCFLYTPTLCLPFRNSNGSIDRSFTPNHDELLETLQAFTKEYEKYYSAKERPAVEIGPHVSCGLGKRILSVDIHGDVFPCQALHDPDLVCGNIFSSSIKKIHSDSKRIHELSELSTLDINTCGQCPWALLCSGGCRAFAYNIYRDIKAFNADFCDVLLDSAKRRLVEFSNLT